MLKYHIAIPLGLFLVLLLAGVSFATALFVGLMSGCMAMMVMMMGRGPSEAGHDQDADADPKRE